jgi:trimeric autotransporter adhesin
MNKIHSKVWNASLNQLVVASEFAACRSGVGGRRGERRRLSPSRLALGILTGLIALGGAGWVERADAQSLSCVGAPYNFYSGSTTCVGYLSTATGGGATALGYNANSNGVNATALGYQAIASATNALYVGARAAPGTGALAESAIAIGTDVLSSGSGSISIGVDSVSKGNSSTTVGPLANATGDNSVAMGVRANATATGAVALGGGTNSSGYNGVAVGAGAAAGGLNSIYLGARTAAGTGSTGISSVAIGTDVTANVDYATAIGFQTVGSGVAGVSVGYTANSSGTHAIAVGFQSIASGLNAVYLGARTAAGTGATVDGAIGIGTDVTASGLSSLAAGTVAHATAQNAVALGAGAGASGTTSLAMMNGAKASSTGAIAIGGTAISSGQYAIAVGNSSQALAASTVAFGDSNIVAATAGTGSIAGGHNSQVKGGTGAVALGEGQTVTGNGAVAIGDPNITNGNGAVTMGANNVAAGDATGATAAAGAVAIGNSNQAIGQGSVALGNASKAQAAGGIAFGNAATATNANDVALGSGSTTTTAVGTPSYVIGSTTYNFAGTTPTSTVSVGALNTERTITNVAAGRISGSSTDAINGSQLYAVTQAVQSLTANTPLHYYSVNDGGTTGGNYLNDGATGSNSMAVGIAAAASGSQAVAQGYQANASAGDAIALGTRANASAVSSTAIGVNAAASGASGSTAVGAFANASATNSLALGEFASATGVGASAVGPGANAAAANATALGNLSKALAASTVALGDSNTVAAAAGTGSIAAGHNSQVLGGTGAVALGEGQTVNGNGAVAIGDPNSSIGNGAVTAGANNTSNGDGAVAIGNGNNAQGTGSVALGNTSSALAAGAVAFGNAAVANNANDVALGSGSTTTTAVGTPNYVIAGTTYNFAGTTPNSTVSVGAGGAERTITNVAAGRINGGSTDAINGSQLFATNQAVDNLSNVITAGATHYYSVNDGGTAGGNYANNGATGLNALAAGVDATATADRATALGQGTGVSVLGGVALGAGAVSDRAIAPTSGSILVGTNVIPYNTTDRNLLGAVSVGNTTDFRQITNLADGTQDQDAVSLRQLKGAMSSFSVTPIKYFHANSTATDSLAAGAESVAIGPQTTVNGDNGIGMGNGAIVQQTAPGGTAIGQNAMVNLADGVALGTNATSNGIQAMALGAGTQAAFAGSVALGAGSVTAAAVATPNTTINGTTYNFAGTTPGSTISVGAVGTERTITNVAAGRIDGGSTDAINGSQLFATNQAIGAVGTSVTTLGNTVTNLGNSLANSYGGNTTYDPATGTLNTSITYGGNTYGSLQQVFNQINTGGIKYFHANSNLADSLANGLNSVAIGPVSTANTENAVSIGNGATAGTNIGDVALGAGSVTGAVVATTGTTIAGNSYTYAGTTPTSTVSVGSAGHERTVTNVAAGQVSGSSTDAINGSQLYATNQAVDALNNTVVANATHYYSVNDGGTQGGNYANNGATGLDALAAGVGASATANGSTALGQNTGVSILGGVALGSGAVSDRAIAPASGSILVGTNVVPYNTTDRNLLGAVSLGNTTDFRQITNLADGTQDQDAVSLRQLKGAMSSFSVTPTKYFHANSAATDSLAAGAESVAIGPQTTVNGDNGIGMGNGAIVQQTAPGGTAIGQNATVNLADGVALGTNATSNGIQAMALGAGTQAAFAGSVALGAGSKTDAAVGTASTTLNGTTYNFAGATPGSTVSVGSVGAERTLTNVAAGRISATSTDAINGSQLFATDQTLSALYSQLINLNNIVNNLPQGGTGSSINTYQTSTDNTSNASATGNNSTAVGAGSTASGNSSTAVGAGSTASGNNSVAVGAGSVASQANSVSVGSAGNERTVTNVAAGVNNTDAVNVGQLNQAIQTAKDWSKDYVDQRFQGVDRDLNRIGNRADAGVAAAMAMASLPQAYQPNQSSAGVALGSFHGEAGIAIGMSTITESGHYVFKLNATSNSRGDTGAGVGAGVVW